MTAEWTLSLTMTLSGSSQSTKSRSVIINIRYQNVQQIIQLQFSASKTNNVHIPLSVFHIIIPPNRGSHTGTLLSSARLTSSSSLLASSLPVFTSACLACSCQHSTYKYLLLIVMTPSLITAVNHSTFHFISNCFSTN